MATKTKNLTGGVGMYGEAVNIYNYILRTGDPRVTSWPLMETPLPLLGLTITYLVVVIQGPKLMESRKPFNLQTAMVAYNFALVLLSAYMFYEFFMSTFLANYSMLCQPVDYSDNPLALRMASVCWLYFFSKIIEYIDTVFFILRKKNKQITFLHVYHHTSMPFNWWMGTRYIAGGQASFHAMLNSFVHVVMYSYYGLSAMGPKVHKYLWWKKYLTTLQLTQFFIIILHTGNNMLRRDCDFPQGFNYWAFSYVMSLIVLFANFYRSAYVKQRSKVE